MRSRYSAYATQNSEYLLQTWHHTTKPKQLRFDDAPSWLQLQIISCENGKIGDLHGTVEFKARYFTGNKAGTLHEKSRFVFENNSWFYLDGEILSDPDENRPGRNTPCPCLSGKKFKHCCGI